jgi:hypothetical protein
MWLKTGYQPERPKPRPDDGERLATFQRNHGDEMRVTMAAFNGHPYVSLRLWSPDPQTGELWPVKGRGCSLRTSELPELAEALRKAAGTLQAPARRDAGGPDGGPPAEPPRMPRRGPGRSRQRPWSGRGPKVGPTEGGFDEF